MIFNARRISECMVVATVAVLGACGTTPDTQSGTEQELNRAQATLNNFQKDPEMRWFRDHVKDARAVLISPRVTRAGFVVGGSGGEAIVLARDGKSTRWVGPAFYNMGSGSVGFQIGVDVSEVVMLVMSDKGLNALLSPEFTLGGDLSVAAGPVGIGASSSVTTDLISYARSKGAYAGISLAGAVIRPDTAANEAYYGKSASPVDILVRKNVDNPTSASLRESLTRMAGR